MKIILAVLILISTSVFALDTNDEKLKSKKRLEKQIKKEMEKEKKYAREQTFYSGANYNLKDSEVNEESLETLPEIEVEDFDMDSVYD